jgi:hypothetical protein
MKRAMFSVLTVLVLASLIGCARNRLACNGCGDGCCAEGQQGCQSCDDPNNGNGGPACDRPRCSCRLFGRGGAADAGPEVATAPAGAVDYPYYTTRGPRDFLAKNPPSIGP